MKKILLILILGTMVFAAETNTTKPTKEIKIIKKQDFKKELEVLKKILKDIKTEDIKKYKTKEKTEDLFIRMKINQNNGYTLAANRDYINIKKIKLDNEFYKTLKKIIILRNQYKEKEEFKKTIKDFYELVEKTKKDISKFQKVKETSKVSKEYNNATKEIKKKITYYEIVAAYLNENINSFKKEKYLSLNKIIDKIDNNPTINKINNEFEYFFNTTIGRFIIASFMLIIITTLYIFIIPIVALFIRKLLNKTNENINEYVINSTKKPLIFIMFVFAIQVFLNILLTKDEASLSILHVIAYWFGFLWLFRNLITNFIEVFSEDILKKYPDMRKEVLHFSNRFITIIFVLILIAIVLTKLGVNIGAVVGGLGFIGLGASLAFKDTFSNFLGSINILFDKSFSVGDWVVINDNIEGTVIEIGMRKTRIRSFDNAEITVPNSIIANSKVVNWNRRKIGRRIKMKIGLTYNSNPEQLEKFTKDLKEYFKKNKDISNEKEIYQIKGKSSRLIKKEDDIGIKKTLLVYVDSLNDFSIDILVYTFSKTTNWEEWLKVKQEVILNIMRIVKENDLEFAYPTQVNILEGKNEIKKKI
jgi:MscS family membrane protein